MRAGDTVKPDYVNALVNEEGFGEAEAGLDRGSFCSCLSRPVYSVFDFLAICV
jgi:hypothetical protein